MNLPELLLCAARAICIDHASTGIVSISGSPVFANSITRTVREWSRACCGGFICRMSVVRRTKN